MTVGHQVRERGSAVPGDRPLDRDRGLFPLGERKLAFGAQLELPSRSVAREAPLTFPQCVEPAPARVPRLLEAALELGLVTHSSTVWFLRVFLRLRQGVPYVPGGRRELRPIRSTRP